MSTMLTFSIFSVVFLAIGIVLYVMSDEIIEVVKQYDTACELCERDLNADCKPCNVMIDNFPKDVNEPIYVYYQLDNFYQNHRRYVKSRDNEQLQGKWKSREDLESACDPIVKVGDLWKYQKYSIADKEKKTALKDDEPAIPCGLVAKSFFDDSFELYKFKDQTKALETDYKINKDADPETIGDK